MSTGHLRGFRFPRVVAQHAVWLYARFALGLCDVEELLAERGIVVSCETVRAWFARFGPAIARGLRSRRGGSNGRWHLDEMVILSAKSAAWASAAKRVTRVLARGSPSSQRTTREAFIAAAMQTCWSPLFASPT